jgi:hypothetical protein
MSGHPRASPVSGRLQEPCDECPAVHECLIYAKSDGKIVGWFECRKQQKYENLTNV